MLIGRKLEIRKLNEAFQAEESQFVAVYGRRRVGKTYLVREVFNYKFTFQHSGIANNPLSIQLERFRASLLKQGLEDCPHLASWFDAFDQLEILLNRSRARKKVIFLDEAAWMETPKSSFVSALENFWNSIASNRKDVLLIICASATSWLVKNIIKNRGGLHNRVTKKIPLSPFTLKECEEFAQMRGLKFKRYHIVQLYMVLGGVAMYWSLLDKSLSVSQNIDALFFGRSPALKGEFNELYDALFKNPAPYKKIIMSLSRKKEGITRTELTKIAQISDGGALSDRLAELEECGFILSSRCYPKAKKEVLYTLVDNFTIFYFKFIRDNESVDDFWTKGVDSRAITSWSGLAFERVCRQHIIQMKSALGISSVLTKEFAWQSDLAKLEEGQKGAQIDLLIERADNTINICEMKWYSGKYALDKDAYTELVRKVEVFSSQVHPKSMLRLTLVTSYGVIENAYTKDIDQFISVDDLFV